MMRLHKGERCPIHKSYSCCGRLAMRPKPNYSREGVLIVPDPHHPRGYREKHSAARLRQDKNKMLLENPVCFYCEKNFIEAGTEYGRIVVAHKESKASGGARHDSHPDNLALACWECNDKNGSKRPTGKAFGQFKREA